jgi:hypothetical protein
MLWSEQMSDRLVVSRAVAVEHLIPGTPADVLALRGSFAAMGKTMAALRMLKSSAQRPTSQLRAKVMCATKSYDSH